MIHFFTADAYQKVLILRKKSETPTRELLVHDLFFAHEMRKGINPLVSYEFSLQLYSIKQHGR